MSVMVIRVTLLPPSATISKPSEPTMTSRGTWLLAMLVPLTWYARMIVAGWVWFCSTPVKLLYVLYCELRFVPLFIMV